MKPKKLPLLTVEDFRHLVSKVEKEARKSGLAIGEVSIHLEGTTGQLTLEHNGGGVPAFMAELLGKNGRITVTAEHHFDGQFDWDADTYLKDASVVYFKFY